MAAARAGELRGQIKAEEAKLRTAINDLTAKGQAIDMREVAALVQGEIGFAFIRGLDAILSDDAKLRAIEDARSIGKWLAGEGQALMMVMRATAKAPRLADLAKILELQRVLARMPAMAGDDLEAVGFFIGFAPHCHGVLEDFIRQYHAAKQPLFGFVFRRGRARAIDQELGRQLPCRSALEAHRRIGVLVRAASVLSSLRVSFGKAGIAVEHHHWAYQQVIDKIVPLAERAPEILTKVVRVQAALARDSEFAAGLGIGADDLGWVAAAAAEGSLLARLGDFAAEYRRMGERFGALPEFDYVGDKSSARKPSYAAARAHD